MHHPLSDPVLINRTMEEHNNAEVHIIPAAESLENHKTQQKEQYRGCGVIALALTLGIIFGAAVSQKGARNSASAAGTVNQHKELALMLLHINESLSPCTNFAQYATSVHADVPVASQLSGPAAEFFKASRTMKSGTIASPGSTTAVDALTRGLTVNGVSAKRYYVEAETVDPTGRTLIFQVEAEETQTPQVMHTISLKCRPCISDETGLLTEKVPTHPSDINATCEFYVEMMSRSMLGCQCCGKTPSACNNAEAAVILDPETVCQKMPLRASHTFETAIDHAFKVSDYTSTSSVFSLFDIAAHTWPTKVTLPAFTPAAHQRARHLAREATKILAFQHQSFQDATVFYTWATSYETDPPYAIDLTQATFDDVLYNMYGHLAQRHVQETAVTTSAWTINPFKFEVQYNVGENSFYVSPALTSVLDSPSAFSDGLFSYHFLQAAVSATQLQNAVRWKCTPPLKTLMTTDEAVLLLGSRLTAANGSFTLNVKNHLPFTPDVQFMAGMSAGITDEKAALYSMDAASHFGCNAATICSLH